ncbi:hypothetical protein, partial [Acidiphilium sp.]|uniref:hypothetical protein n=1 Tax=Acidiphilium sp. TaxID=527 RepID=UPI00258C833C
RIPTTPRTIHQRDRGAEPEGQVFLSIRKQSLLFIKRRKKFYYVGRKSETSSAPSLATLTCS